MKSLLYHLWATTAHKYHVFVYCLCFCLRLLYRALLHDISKYSSTETRGFVKVIKRLKGLTYGTSEYQKNLKSIEEPLKHHYGMNPHHPEHYNYTDPAIRNMNLTDIIEMLCDWKAAIKRHKDGDLHRSLRVNTDRYKISPDLVQILHNTLFPGRNPEHQNEACDDPSNPK